MKDSTSIAVVFIVCLILLLLYFFVFQSAFNRTNDLKAQQLAELIEEQRNIVWMGSQISEFQSKLPEMKRKINYYKLAIPTEIEDERFFDHLASELQRNDVELLEIQQTGNRPWLGTLSTTDEENYGKLGLDVNAIKRIRSSNFKIRVLGEFKDVLTVCENLKSLGRLYTIDQVVSPAGAGGGTVLVDNSGNLSQMEITGSLYYGIPANYRDAAGLDRKYMEVAVIRNSQEISNSVKDIGRGLVTGEEKAPEAGAVQEDGGEAEQDEVPADGAIQSLAPHAMTGKDRG